MSNVAAEPNGLGVKEPQSDGAVSSMHCGFSMHCGDSAVVATAIHCGHEVRSEVVRHMVLPAADRLREEDPYTDHLTNLAETRVIVHRSRFEVDMNRPPERAVYLSPDDCWGLRLYDTPPPADVVERSRAEHDAFYAALRQVLDKVVARHGYFLLYDLHSYNHRRGGPLAGCDPVELNPEVNLGTAWLDGDRFGTVASTFMAALRRQPISGPNVDVRENVKFRGGYLPQWVRTHYPKQGVALAVECKKTFMDEWSGEVDRAHLTALGDALRATVEPTLRALQEICAPGVPANDGKAAIEDVHNET